MKLRILTEASGSLTSGYIIKAIHEAGHLCVASDVDEGCAGRYLADDFVKIPSKDDPALWRIVERIAKEKNIDVVIPSLDETLQGWAERKEQFQAIGLQVILSEPPTIATCQDKWKTFCFFREYGIPTAATSLTQDFPLVKPRRGRGAVGVRIAHDPVNMDGLVSQELLEGTEYTVDVFCDRSSAPVYIVPRRRINVRDGKSTAGVTENNPDIVKWCKKICQKLPFIGPVNIQCFLLKDGSIKFLEINPRLAGGMALGFAATENWIDLMINNIVHGKKLSPVNPRFGMEMRRYYAEVFISPN